MVVVYLLTSIAWHNLVPERALSSDVWPTPGEVVQSERDGEHITFVDVSSPDGTGSTILDLRLKPGGRGPRSHVHPESLEVFRVQHGQLNMVVDGVSMVLTGGDTAYVRGGQAHRFFNSSTSETRFRVFLYPGGQMPRALKEVHQFLKESSGNPIAETLQMMRFADAYDVYLGSVPVWLQKIGLFTVVPTARLLGFRPSVLEDEPGQIAP